VGGVFAVQQLSAAHLAVSWLAIPNKLTSKADLRRYDDSDGSNSTAFAEKEFDT
jgi:hypothetical protein